MSDFYFLPASSSRSEQKQSEGESFFSTTTKKPEPFFSARPQQAVQTCPCEEEHNHQEGEEGEEQKIHRKADTNTLYRQPAPAPAPAPAADAAADAAGTCPTYEPNEVTRSRTAAGWITPDVSLHTADKVLFADFGNNHSFVKRSAITEPLWTTWKSTFLTDGSYRIKILGFSDCSGNEAVNIAIRRARAAAIRRELGAAITPKVSAQENAPIAETVVANDTPENRAKNRSVVIQHKQGFFTEPDAVANANEINPTIQSALAELSASTEARERNVPEFVRTRAMTIEPLTARHEGTVVTPTINYFPGTNYALTFTLPQGARFHIYNGNANIAIQGRNMPDITAPATVDQIKERIVQAVSEVAHLAGAGPVAGVTTLEQYKAQFNAWWPIAPYNSMGTEFNPALNSFGPRTVRAREIFNKIYAENATVKTDYDNNTGGIKEKIDAYNLPEGFNLVNSVRVQALRDVFTANVPPIAAANYPAFKTAVETAAANLDSDDRIAINASNDWMRLIDQYVREDLKRQEIRRIINTPPAALAPPPPPPPAPAAGGGRVARDFLNNIRIDGPAAAINANNASETVTLTPKSTRTNPGLALDTRFTVTPAARVIGNSISPLEAWPAAATDNTPFDVQVSNLATVTMNAHLDVLNLSGGITAPVVPEFPFTITDNRQTNLVATWFPAFEYSEPGGNHTWYNPGATVRYVGGGQQFRVSAWLPPGSTNPGLTVSVISRLKKGAAIVQSNVGAASSFPNGARSSTPILLNISAPAVVPVAGDAYVMEVDLVDSTGALMGATKTINFTVLRENVYTQVDAMTRATEDNIFFHDNSAAGLLGTMTARGGLAARVAAAVNTPRADGGIVLLPLTARHDSAAYVAAANGGTPNPALTGYFAGMDYSHSMVDVGGAAGFRTENFPDLGSKVIVLNRTLDVVLNTKRTTDELITLLTHEAVHSMDVRPDSGTPIERYKTEFRAYWMDGRYGPPDHPTCTGVAGTCYDTTLDPTIQPPGPKAKRASVIFLHLYNSPATYPFVKDNYDNDPDFRQQVDNYIYPDGINLIASVRLERLRAIIDAYTGAGFAALRTQVRQFMGLDVPAPAGGALDADEKATIRNSRAWRDLVARKVTVAADQATLKTDLSIPTTP